MAPHSSTLAWKIPWTEEPGRLQSIRSLQVRHDWATSLSHIGEGNGNPLQCSCLGNPRGGRAWWAAVYGVAQGRTWLKWLSSVLTWTMTNHSKPYSHTGVYFWIPECGYGMELRKDDEECELWMKNFREYWIFPDWQSDLRMERKNHDSVTNIIEKWRRQFLSILCQGNFWLNNHDKERRKVIESGGAATTEYHTLRNSREKTENSWESLGQQEDQTLGQWGDQTCQS